MQIGVGGIGCSAAQFLVSSGLGNLTLVDDDHVSVHNLPRQILFSDTDVGQTKVDAARQRLQSLNPYCKITSIAQRIDQHSLVALLARQDLIIDCTDSLDSRNQINRAARQAGTPLVMAAAIRTQGMITSFTSDGPCYACMSQFFSHPELSCVESGVLSPVVGIMGNLQALEAIKLLTGLGRSLVGRLAMFDGITMQWQEFALNADPQCAVCGNNHAG